MNEFKLVPVKPTPEMERAAESYWNERRFMGLSDDPRTWAGVYQAMLAAAPAVQGEPVAVMYEDGSVLSKADCGGNFEFFCKVLTPLYAAPQPAEQQPAPDVAALVTLLEHARCNTCDGSGAFYDGHGQVRQCQWCHERSAALAAHRRGAQP